MLSMQNSPLQAQMNQGNHRWETCYFPMLALRFPKRMSHLEENDTWIAEAIHDFESTMLLIPLLQSEKKKEKNKKC